MTPAMIPSTGRPIVEPRAVSDPGKGIVGHARRRFGDQAPCYAILYASYCTYIRLNSGKANPFSKLKRAFSHKLCPERLPAEISNQKIEIAL